MCRNILGDDILKKLHVRLSLVHRQVPVQYKLLKQKVFLHCPLNVVEITVKYDSHASCGEGRFSLLIKPIFCGVLVAVSVVVDCVPIYIYMEHDGKCLLFHKQKYDLVRRQRACFLRTKLS